MRNALAGLLVAGVLAAALTPAGAAAATSGRDRHADGVRRQLAAGIQVAPKHTVGSATRTRIAGPAASRTANPFLGLVANPATVDYRYWRAVTQAKSAHRTAARVAAERRLGRDAVQPVLHDEAEPEGTRGGNDTPAAGELLTGFGSGPAANPKARVLGALSPEVATVVSVDPAREDNGSIRLAHDTGIVAQQNGASTTGTVGDGPHGSHGDSKGDFDFYKLTAKAGMEVVADLDTPTGDLDTVTALYSATGRLLASNDDESIISLDSLLRYQVTADGTYYLMISGFGAGTALPADPNDSASGPGVGSEGPYNLTLSAAYTDTDAYSLDLAAGDVIGATVKGAARRLSVYDPRGRLVIGSGQDATGTYPASTPLPGGGNAVIDHVAAQTGRYTLAVSEGGGAYDVTVEVYRPGPETEAAGTVQTLFLDLDGERLNTTPFGGSGVRTLSPLRGFLGRWGLTAADEDALVDRIVATVRENYQEDLAARGNNGRFAVRILNSRDDADPWGQPNVSRVVLGGSVAQSGMSTIGISQSVDPGNFARQETAVVLLDTLSDPAGTPGSLNTYLTAASDRVGFVGRALGIAASHEAGHFYGSWHADQFDTVPDIMDQGGNFPVLYGVGADGAGGTADDVDVDFGEDTLNPSEGFLGTQDSLDNTAFALGEGGGLRSGRLAGPASRR
jgi:hypothetical protein